MFNKLDFMKNVLKHATKKVAAQGTGECAWASVSDTILFIRT